MSYQDQQLTGCVTQGKSLNPSGFLFPDVSLTYWTRCSCSHVTWVSGDKEPVNMCLQKRFWRRDGPGLALLPHFIPACWALFCSWLVVYSRETGFPFLCRVFFFFSLTKYGDKLYLCQVPFNSRILPYQRNLFHWGVKQKLNHFMVLQLLGANH